MNLKYYRRGSELVFQLYLYPYDKSLDSSRVTNLDMTIVKDVENISGLKPIAKHTTPISWHPSQEGNILLRVSKR
ncbi:hypothetical protein AS144_04745 [Francisella endosymbiont of Amblyomma maculatum]|nr:hypothetical protein AS144_04745 [Francisella endosymbiont of Amblyomma maculatum]